MRDRAACRLILVLDENLSGHSIVNGLRAAGVPVQPLTDLMPRGLSDEEVLSNLAAHEDCFLLSKDSDFHRKPSVWAALMKQGIGAFIITAHKGKNAVELVELVKGAWPRIRRCAGPPPALRRQDTGERARGGDLATLTLCDAPSQGLRPAQGAACTGGGGFS